MTWLLATGGVAMALWAVGPWSWWSRVWTWLGRWWQVPIAVLLLVAAVTVAARRSGPMSTVGEPDGAGAEVMRPLTPRTILFGGLTLLGVGITAAVVLLVNFAGTDPRDRLDAIRTAATLLVGTGGAAALLLAARRQRAAELTLAVQRKAATDTAHDAAARRITELYLKAVEQLGSDKAAVRHGGLYALERVAQDNPDQRQTVINVICAYLRSPYTPPSEQPAARRTGLPAAARRGTAIHRAAAAHRTHLTAPVPTPSSEQVRQEREVRLTAQRILTTHLRTDPGMTTHQPTTSRYWGEGYDLDLTGATLINFHATGLTVRQATFTSATFSGVALFDGVAFSGDALFDGVAFSGVAHFGGATFSGVALFGGVAFSGVARFGGATFSGVALFDGATFSDVVHFGGVAFSGDAWFVGVAFSCDAHFVGVAFSGDAHFGGATFSGAARFGGATFSGAARFDGGTFSGVTWFDGVAFSGDAHFGGVAFSGVAHFGGVAFSGDALFNEVAFSGVAWFDGATFFGIALFDGGTFTGEALFNEVVFSGAARFVEAAFSSVSRFVGATFFGAAWFVGVVFSGAARFAGATFTSVVHFGGAAFSGDALFGRASFAMPASMKKATVQVQVIPLSAWPPGWTVNENPGVDAVPGDERVMLPLVPVPEVIVHAPPSATAIGREIAR
ncbi:pentapeptide repeat-containing protein [Umezawaea sp. Da 62-37]|uniref:pentapeptide repeat-containing protein n=1 Tax=Umezawaea sp. Da 62-37 TaxID=3075927 RepID=UPI0028F71E9C|nr:pentapeptide repeat-containing protein [Umezawaea sp. Da 62-37]WNV84921.1 pentapeptide repeat-containing protein [Umezawaea sp. Da 62-37]